MKTILKHSFTTLEGLRNCIKSIEADADCYHNMFHGVENIDGFSVAYKEEFDSFSDLTAPYRYVIHLDESAAEWFYDAATSDYPQVDKLCERVAKAFTKKERALMSIAKVLDENSSYKEDVESRIILLKKLVQIYQRYSDSFGRLG